MTDTVEAIMTAQGYTAAPTGAGHWTWRRPTADGSALWVCTYDNQLDGDPLEPGWYCGRHGEDDAGSFVQCEDFMPLADALALAERLTSPKVLGAEAQVTLPRAELEGQA